VLLQLPLPRCCGAVCRGTAAAMMRCRRVACSLGSAVDAQLDAAWPMQLLLSLLSKYVYIA
jgi:hypothetical protein